MAYNPVIDIRTIHLWHITCTSCGASSPETPAGLNAAFELARAEGWECGPESLVAFCCSGCANAWHAGRNGSLSLRRWTGRALAMAGR